MQLVGDVTGRTIEKGIPNVYHLKIMPYIGVKLNRVKDFCVAGKGTKHTTGEAEREVCLDIMGHSPLFYSPLTRPRALMAYILALCCFLRSV